MVKIYKQPFAHDGDTIAIPDASQPDGKMSSADGWTPDYQLPKADPNYKPVGRQEMNGVFKEVTEALGQVQVQGAASWSAEGAPFPINAQVYHNGKQWLALRENSVEPAEGEDWAAIGTAATANLTTSNLDGTVGRVMKVGDGGWMGQGVASSTPFGYPASINDVTNQTKVIRAQTGDNGVAGHASGIHFAVSDTWGRLRVSFDEPIAWIQGGASSLGTGWTSQVVLSANILQTTGTSTGFPMSQKAVTDAIAASGGIGVGQTWQDLAGSRNGETWYTNDTGRAIQVACYTQASGVHFQVRANAGANIVNLSDLYGSNNERSQLPFIVPPGWQYRLDKPKLSSYFHWVELR